MKVLLVAAPFHHPHKDILRLESLGQLYLASSLRQKGFQVSVFDPTLGPPLKTEGGYHFGIPASAWAAVLRDRRPDVIGITCNNAFSLEGAELVARTAKSSLSPEVVTVAGGVYPSVYKGRMLAECPSIDFAFQGESEGSLVEFLSDGASAGGKKSSLDGLMFRSGGAITINPKRRFIQDLDGLPFPARDLVDIKTVMNRGTMFYGLGDKPALSILTSRSCPNGCAFCNMWTVQGQVWRPRSPRNVVDELDVLVNTYGARQVFVMDDNFTHDPERAKGICEDILRRGLKLEWNTPHGISVKGMDLELASLMKKAGCVNVCIGIESGSEWVRNGLMGKNVSDEQIVRALACLKKAGIPAFGLLLLGYPGETEARFKESLALIRRLPLSLVTAGFVCPFPGTRLYDQLSREGVIGLRFSPPLDDYLEPVFAPPGTRRSELKKRRARLLRAFYFSHLGQISAEMAKGKTRWIIGRGIRRLLAM